MARVREPAALMLHPAVLVAGAVLVLNDHFLKASYASWWTGKLSDVAGLFFFPLLLQATGELIFWVAGRYRAPSSRMLFASAIATAIGFSLIKIWTPAAQLYRATMGNLTMDWSDLLALPMILVAVWIGDRASAACPSGSDRAYLAR